MRISLRQPSVQVLPGQPVRVGVEVTNTLEVIDGVSVAAEVPEGLSAAASPGLLPLFPDTSGPLELELQASANFPAGSYEVPVSARSSARTGEAAATTLTVVVPPAPSGELSVLPPVRSTRHRSRYRVVCDNTGNTTLHLALAGSDAEHHCEVRFADASFEVAPGASASTEMTVTRHRRLLGGETSAEVTVLATSPELDLDSRAVLRHRPLVPRGARVAVVLGAIVAVWAAVFLVALSHAFAGDTLTKAVPASFYASDPAASRAKLDALDGASVFLASSGGSSAPAGAVPKSGVVIGVGGTVAGTVDAASTDSGVGRISVDAYQQSPTGERLVASSATGQDGAYSIVGLLPGAYTIEFSAAGYTPLWYPAAASQGGARPVVVTALATTGGIDATVVGHPGSISGTVLTGETPSPPVTVTVVPEQGATTTPIATATTDAAGDYTIADLPAPGVYDLSFSANGYQVASDSEQIAGGQHDIANTVTLSAADGTISGSVTAAGAPLGGVTVSATAGGKTYRTATPTTGDVGAFTLADLPSPATYLLSFTKPGYGSVSVGQALGPGQVLTGLAVRMNGGAGTVSGQVVSAATGLPLGGVTVSAESGSSTATVETFNGDNAQLGTYELSGLATPATYTLTFSLDGYTPETISVHLASSGSATNVDVRLPQSVGSVSGCVTSHAESSSPSGQCIDGIAGVAVSITDGSTVSTTVSASSPAGFFTFAGLAPGTYTLSFSLQGYQPATYVLTLAPGTNPVIELALEADP